MNDCRPVACPISGLTDARRIFAYTEPPVGEVGFKRAPGQAYYREVWQFDLSKHFVSTHRMDVATSYGGDYVDATYMDATGMARTFARIIALPPDRSDNAGRIHRIVTFAQGYFERSNDVRLLDVGSGLGVFPWAVKQAGWTCTALDPDPRAVRHIKEVVGVNTVCGDFMAVASPGRFDIITFNKVLEHVPDPIEMLRRAHDCIAPGGFVYIEVPDGEMASLEGPGREEFFIEHLHIFGFSSLAMLINRSGFEPLLIERLVEPSSKYTLRAFCVAGGEAHQ
jgi:SAM-dependent methyltransferase